MEKRRALVTGGNRGIGFGIAEGLVAAGHEVVVAARDAAAGAEAAGRIGAESVVLDLADRDSIAAAMREVGEVDILVNNAGVCPRDGMLENPDGVRECLAVMVDAPFRLICLAVPGMRRRGWGRIVNLSSGWGSFAEGLGGPNGYGVAKAGLNAVTLAVSRELPAGVKVNAVCPGWVRTRMGGAGATRSVAEGAATAIWLALLPDDGPTGGFFRDKRPVRW